MSSTKKPVLNQFGEKGNTWAARIIGAAIEQTKGMISNASSEGVTQIGGVKIGIKNVMNTYGSVEFEYKNKLKEELKAQLQLRGQDPKILLKMEIGELQALKKELKETPMPRPKAPRPEPK